MFKTIILSSFLFSAIHFSSACDNIQRTQTAETAPVVDNTIYGKLDTAYFASGCFWCVEAIFESLNGVKDAVSGYANGQIVNPTYEQVCTHTTGHAESVMVLYDPKIISYQTLLKVYFASCDPTQVDGQGPDHGSPYRSAIFYRNTNEDKAATAYKEQLNQSGIYKRPIAVSVEAFTVFYKAEDYHQGYEKEHPENPYVQSVSIPRLMNMERQFPELLKKRH
jgi:peptide-methionine (S)-S-oxide reductase